MRSEALDDERVAIELLTAPEKQHRIGTAFEVGPLEVALRSHDGDFIAQPVGLLQRTPTSKFALDLDAPRSARLLHARLPAGKAPLRWHGWHAAAPPSVTPRGAELLLRILL